MKHNRVVIGLLMLAVAGASAQTTAPADLAVEEQSRAMAKRYADALIPAFKLNPKQAEELRATLNRLVEDNARADRESRISRMKTIDEVDEIDSHREPITLRQKRRLAFLFGQLEDIYLAAPLEIRPFAAAIANLVPTDQYASAGRAIVDARRRYALPPPGAKLRDFAPGTPDARAMLVLSRYRLFRKAGLYDGAKELPRELEPADAVKVEIVQFFPIAPPPREWTAYVDGVISRLGLDENQTFAARGVATESVKRADAILAGLKPDIDEANKLADAEFRAAVLAELNRPLDELFNDMKLRIYNLATAEQRERATSQPAAGK